MDKVSELKERLRGYPGAHEGEEWKLEKDLTKCTDKEKRMMAHLGVTPEDLMRAGLNRGEVHHILFGCSHKPQKDMAPKYMHFFLSMIPPTITQQEHKVMVNRKTGRVQFYDPPELRSARAKLTDMVGRYAPEQPLEGALQLVTKWIWPMETDGQGVLSGMGYYRWKTSKPDTDNLIKMLKDCMTRTGYWKDDAQVVSEITQKFYGLKPGIYIEVTKV